MPSLAIYNDKGGTGKSILTANLAVIAASGLWNRRQLRTLVVEIDLQGNLGFDLGFDGDHGEELASALIEGRPPIPMVDVKPGVDVLAGGHHLQEVHDRLVLMAYECFNYTPHMAVSLFSPVFETLEDVYDLIVFDTAAELMRMKWPLMYYVDAVVSPLNPDPAGLEALGRIFSTITAIEQPELRPEFLLAVLNDDALNSSAGREFRDQINSQMAFTGDRFPFSPTSLRSTQATVARAKRLGITVVELVGMAQAGAELPEGFNVQSLPAAATGLATDLLDNCKRALDGLFSLDIVPTEDRELAIAQLLNQDLATAVTGRGF